MPEICVFVSCWESTSVKKGLKFHEKKIVKVLVVQEKAIPLHSLSGSNAVASLISKMILDNIPYRQAVQCVFGFFLKPKVKSKVRNENTNRQIIWYTFISGQYKQFEQLIPFWYYRYNLQRRVWSWLRMNASYRLNTCKSRGFEGACSRETTGARVSNAYPTCPSYWDSLPKGRLIPNNISELHDIDMKDPSMKDGDAFH